MAGLEEFLIDLNALSQDLQLRFAASAAVVELPFSAKQGQKMLSEIVLQAREQKWWISAHMGRGYPRTRVIGGAWLLEGGFLSP